MLFLGVVPDVNIVPVNISYEKVKTESSDVGTGLAFFRGVISLTCGGIH